MHQHYPPAPPHLGLKGIWFVCQIQPKGSLITLHFAWHSTNVSSLSLQVKERKGPPTYHTDLYKSQETAPPKGLTQCLALKVDLLNIITLSNFTIGNREFRDPGFHFYTFSWMVNCSINSSRWTHSIYKTGYKISVLQLGCCHCGLTLWVLYLPPEDMTPDEPTALLMSSPFVSYLSHPVSMPEKAETYCYSSFKVTPPWGHKSLSCLPILYVSCLVLLPFMLITG